MKRDFSKILENLINHNLYSFLKALTSEGFKEKCETLRLSDEQIGFLETLYPLALKEKEPEFLLSLERESNKHPGLYPIEIDPDSLHVSSPEPYSQLLKGKRIVLVGPSVSTIEKKQGALIESYDYVVRLNFQWPLESDLVPDLGKRMDILYHCCNGDFPISSILNDDFNKTKFVCYERNIESRVLRRYCDKHNIGSLDVSSVYKDLENRFGGWANTGTVAISHLMQFDFSELFITGISFFKDRYHEGYKGLGREEVNGRKGDSLNYIRGHYVEPQIKYCREILISDSRVRLDDKLRDVFDKSVK